MSVTAIVFDLDGVIVKTNLVKYTAMLSLFADHPQYQGSISEFILANGGVPRRTKLSRLLKHNLGIEPTEALLSEYLRRYAVELECQLGAAPMVEGVAEFIGHYPGSCYVCSSAPEAEVHEQVSRRSLTRHFAAIYGSNTPKPEALRTIATAHSTQSVVFFGDSVGDYEASCQAGVAFVGVVCECDNFRGMPVVKLQDFTHRPSVQEAMVRAAAQGSA